MLIYNQKRVFDPETGSFVRLKLSTKAIKTLDRKASLSSYKRALAK